MTGKRHESRPAPEPPAALVHDDGTAGLVADLLGVGRRVDEHGLGEGRIASWAEDRGILQSGRAVRLGASCLLRPEPGDQVVTWQCDGDCWVLNVLQRANADAPAVIATTGAGLAVHSTNIALAGQAVHIAAEDFLTSTRNRHAVEDTRTETCKLRVSQIGTDIRRAITADEEISGTLLQRAGTWLSTTVRDARLRARTFLFD